MKKSKKKAAAQIDPYLEGLMGKLLDRLTSLDRKMDAVLSRAGARPAGSGEQHKTFEAPRVNEPSRRERIMHEAICADCQKVCEVPFKPAEGRAIYCKPCFAKRKSGGPGAVNVRPVAVYQKQAPANIPQAAAVPVRAAPAKAKKKTSAKKTKKK